MNQPTLAPSNITTWQGAPVAGSRFTTQQHEVMLAARPGWARFNEHGVQPTYPATTQWGPPTITYAPCPIIAWSRDGLRRQIVTPAGEKIWVNTSTDRSGAENEGQ